METTTAGTRPDRLTGLRVISRVVWGFALAAIVLQASNAVMTFEAAQSAPQQGAAAAWACFQIIVPYTIARAIHGALTA
jgi:hypothetical protein